MVKDHFDSEKGNPLPPHRLLFPINSKGSFICTIKQTGQHIPQPLLHQSWSTGWNDRNGDVGLKKAWMQFNVPRSTHQRRFLKEGSSEIAAQKGLGSRHPCLSEDEKEMVDHLTNMEVQLFGFTPKQLRELFFQFVEINHIPYNSNK